MLPVVASEEFLGVPPDTGNEAKTCEHEGSQAWITRMPQDRRGGTDNLSMFHSLLVWSAACFAIRLHPEIGEKVRNMFKAIAAL